MKYGDLIFSDDKEIYFINRVIDDTKYEVIKEDDIENFLIIDKNKTNVSMLYKQYTNSYVKLNNIVENSILTIDISGGIKSGKVVDVDIVNDSVTLDISGESNSIQFNGNGIPLDIKNINISYVSEEIYKNVKRQEEDNTQLNGENINTEELTYFFTLEQQISQLREDLEKPNMNQIFIKNIEKTLKRYVELYDKYHDDTGKYMSQSENKFDKYIRGDNNIFYKFLSDKIKVEVFNNFEKHSEKGVKEMIKFNDMPRKYTSLNDTINLIDFLDDNKDDKDVLLNNIIIKAPQKKEMEHNVYVSDGIYIYNGREHQPHFIKLHKNTKLPVDTLIINSTSKIRNEINKKQNILKRIFSKDVEEFIENNISVDRDEDNLSSLYKNKPYIFYSDKRNVNKSKKYKIENALNKITPTLNNILNFYGNVKYTSTHSIIEKLNIFDKCDINKKEFELCIKIIRNNLKQYKNNLRLIYRDSRHIEKTDELYNELLNINANEYYTVSEKLNMTCLNLIEYNIWNNNKGDVKIDLSFDKDIENQSNYIHKIYKNKEEMDNDRIPYIHLSKNKTYISIDDINENKIDKINSLDVIYDMSKQIYKGDKKDIIKWLSIDKSGDGNNYNDIYHLVVDYKLRTGNRAYVLDEENIYIYNGENNWILAEENSEAKFLSDEKYNNIIKEIEHHDINMNEQSKNEIIKKHNIFEKQRKNRKHKYSLYKQNLSNNLKKNNILSPNLELFHEILSEIDRDKRIQMLSIFINKNTISNPNDTYWLYCVKSGTKLVPSFFKDLCDAHINDLYDQKVEQLCLTQCYLEDDTYIDKYSGYIIKHIDFVEDVKFTKDGKPNLMRSEIKNIDGVEISEEDEIIYDNIENISELINLTLTPTNIVVLISLFHDISYLYNGSKGLTPQKFIYILLCSMLVYYQIYNELSESGSYFTCKSSLGGFPLNPDESITDGIDYFICIFNNLIRHSKNKYPWSELGKRKGNIDKNIIMDIMRLVKENENINTKLKSSYKKSLNKVKKSPTWSSFLPKLREVNIPDTKKGEIYDIYRIQKDINNISNIRDLISINHTGEYNLKNYFYLDSSNLNEIKANITKYKSPPSVYEYLISSNINTRTYLYKTSYKTSVKNKINILKFNISHGDETDNIQSMTDHELELYAEKKEGIQKIKIPFKNIFTADKKKNKIKQPDKFIFNDIDILSEEGLLSIEAYINENKRKMEATLMMTIKSDDKLHFMSILSNRVYELIFLIPQQSVHIYKSIKKWNIARSHDEQLKNAIKSLKFEQKFKLSKDEQEIFKEVYYVLKNTEHMRDINVSIMLWRYILLQLINIGTIRESSNLINNYYNKMNKILTNDVEKMNKIHIQLKDKEKQAVMDGLAKMTEIDRRSEMELKSVKLGMWSVDSKVYKYDKKYFESTSDIMKAQEENSDILNMQYDGDINPEMDAETMMSLSEYEVREEGEEGEEGVHDTDM